MEIPKGEKIFSLADYFTEQGMRQGVEKGIQTIQSLLTQEQAAQAIKKLSLK